MLTNANTKAARDIIPVGFERFRYPEAFQTALSLQGLHPKFGLVQLSKHLIQREIHSIYTLPSDHGRNDPDSVRFLASAELYHVAGWLTHSARRLVACEKAISAVLPENHSPPMEATAWAICMAIHYYPANGNLRPNQNLLADFEDLLHEVGSSLNQGVYQAIIELLLREQIRFWDSSVPWEALAGGGKPNGPDATPDTKSQG